MRNSLCGGLTASRINIGQLREDGSAILVADLGLISGCAGWSDG